MVDENIIEKINSEIRKLYDEYTSAVSSNDLDKAIDLGIYIMEKLLHAAQDYVVATVNTPQIREVAKGIISYHEKMLAFVRGTQEALKSMPLIYSFGAKEKAVEVLSNSINGLFSFLLGALVIIADILSSSGALAERDKSAMPGVV